MPHSFCALKSLTNESNKLDATPYHGCQTVIFKPFSASSLTLRLVVVAGVCFGCGVLVAPGVAEVLVTVAAAVASAHDVTNKATTHKSRMVFFMGYCASVINGTGMNTKTKMKIIKKPNARRVESRVVI